VQTHQLQAERRLGLDDRPEPGDFGRLFRLYAYYHTSAANLHPKRPVEIAIRNSSADKVVQIPRIVELWREAKELEDRRLLSGRDGNANEMLVLATLCTTSGRSSGTESVRCILQVHGD
jgi:hypothetical protein